MKTTGYLQFIKWYFTFTSNYFVAPRQSLRYISKKERLPTVIVSYILMVLSIPFVILPLFNGSYWFGVLGIILSTSLLALCRFSFIYYLFVYTKCNSSKTSINNEIIVDECIYLRPSKEIRNIISNRYKILYVRGSVFALKYCLMDKAKKHTKNSTEKYTILKITPNRMILGGKVIFSKPISNISELDRYMSQI